MLDPRIGVVHISEDAPISMRIIVELLRTEKTLGEIELKTKNIKTNSLKPNRKH